MSNIIRVKRHIGNIKYGDTVEINNETVTVGKNDVRYDYFYGYSLFGASYPRTVNQVFFKTPIHVDGKPKNINF